MNGRVVLLGIIFLVTTTAQPGDKRTRQCCENRFVCDCVYQHGDVFANCKNLKLNATPTFDANVTKIDLSNNDISTFPCHGELPLALKHLDFSQNNLSNFTKRPFANLSNLVSLDLSENPLYKSDLFKGHGKFGDLMSLTQLSIKFKPPTPRYPKALTEIRNLRSLKLYGVSGAKFDASYKNLRSLYFIDFSGKDKCNISKVEANFFQYTPHIKRLNLSFCNLRIIEKGTFMKLQNLMSLNISNNQRLGFRVLSNVTYGLQYTAIKHFDLSNIHCNNGGGTTIYFDDVKYLSNTSIRTIHANSNRIIEIEQCVISILPTTITYLSLRDNMLQNGPYFLELYKMSGVKEIDVSDQFLTKDSTYTSIGKMFTTCADWRGAPQPRTEGFDCFFERFQMAGDHYKLEFSLPSSLEYLNIENGFIRHPVIIQINFSRQNSLKKINLRNNLLKAWIGPIENLNNLEYIDVSNNMCTNMSSNFFSGFKSLRVLLLSNNLLGNVITKNGLKEQSKTFMFPEKLQILDLSVNRIASLPRGIFSKLHELKTLNLSGNSILEWDVKISHMQTLKVLDLSYNRIQTLDSAIREDMNILINNTSATLSINLTANQLSCSCTNLEFLKWMYKKSKLFTDVNNYTCQYSNGTLTTLHQLGNIISVFDTDCSSFKILILGVTFAIIFALVVLIIALFYRFRWKMRYLYYMTKFHLQGFTEVRQNEDSSNYRYDAFISYADDESEFVEEVVNKLENESSIRLCIHHRDFIAGNDVAGNITNAIHNSRKTVIVLSRRFLKSYWCMYEFNMARMESIYSRHGKNVIFVVMYDNIPNREVPLYVMDILQSKSYLEYTTDPQGRILFFIKLKEAIAT